MLHLEHLLLCIYDFYSGEQMSIIFVTKSVSWSINLIIAKCCKWVVVLIVQGSKECDHNYGKNPHIRT